MAETYTIRRGMLSDAAPLADFAARSYFETFAGSTHPDDMQVFLAEKYGVAQQQAELLDPQMITLIAEEGGAIAGFAQVRRSGEVPPDVKGESAVELWRFYVDRPWHGRGLAHRLMEEVQRVARHLGARNIWLGVWEHNERAKAFYAKYGFRDAGSHSFWVGSDEQIDRIMVASLVPSPSGTGS